MQTWTKFFSSTTCWLTFPKENVRRYPLNVAPCQRCHTLFRIPPLLLSLPVFLDVLPTRQSFRRALPKFVCLSVSVCLSLACEVVLWLWFVAAFVCGNGDGKGQSAGGTVFAFLCLTQFATYRSFDIRRSRDAEVAICLGVARRRSRDHEILRRCCLQHAAMPQKSCTGWSKKQPGSWQKNTEANQGLVCLLPKVVPCDTTGAHCRRLENRMQSLQSFAGSCRKVSSVV